MKKTIIFILSMMLGMSTMVFAQLQNTPKWTNILSDQPETFRTTLVSSSENSIQVNVQVPGFYTTTVTTPRGEAKIVSMPKAVSTAHAGEPNVPTTGIPAIIGDRARMSVRVVDAQYRDFENIEVAPSKGDFSRQIDPSTMPYTYGECYNQDAFFPANNVGLYEPYIIRDFRGQNMVVYPYAYNPVTKTLRVYYDMTIEMYKVDDNGENVMDARKSNTVKMDADFKSMYQRHFINYEASMTKYSPVDEEGDLLIICYDNFISAMTDFVNWKKTRGVNTTIVGTSTAGSTSSALKTYIQNQYNANNNLTHVLLVGDVAQIPGYSYSGASGYTGLGDNPYGQVVGNDIYNDIFVGRFSAQTVAQVTTQVNRVITYERDLTTSATWLQNADGISRKEGGSGHNNEDDYQHMDNIRTDLLNYGYNTVYQDYANLSGYTGTASSISSHINSGVGIVNYCNHGNLQMWGVASYSNTHVNNLTNSNKLPFIWSVACLVGKYDNTSTSYGGNYTIGQNNDCFAEAWMHATYSSSDLTPTGAVGALMSYISQPWIPPMWAQDECIDILVESYNSNIKRTWGGTSINGLLGIFDHYSPSDPSAVGTYQAWILYGDPTMMLRTKTPQAMTVTHPGSINLAATTYTVNVTNGNGALATITDANHNILGSATVSNGTANITLTAPGQIQDLTLCVFGYNKVTYLGNISVVGGAQYTITCNQPEHGSIGAPEMAYGSQTVILTATPETGYCLSSWEVRDANNTPITVTNNQFVMPESDVTVSATFVEGLTVSLASVMNGSISADPNCALQGMTVNLTATPETGYNFVSWIVFKTGDVNTTVPVTGNSFTMPNYDVTVSAIFLASQGGDVTIGSGTSTSEYLPSNVWYKYSTTQQIYTSTEVGEAGTITAISFKYNGNATSGERTIDIYMSHTTNSTITSWVTESSSHLVYSGTQTFVDNGWYTFTLNTPFEYNGTSNILITFDDNTGSYMGSSGRAFYVYSTNAKRAIYHFKDDYNQTPLSPQSGYNYTASTSKSNAQIVFTKEIPSTEGYLSVSPNVLLGFNYAAGEGPSKVQSVAIIGANLQNNVTITAPTGYEISQTQTGTYTASLTLTPTSGSLQKMVYIRLAASLSQGIYNGTMTLVSDNATQAVTLTGEVLPKTFTKIIPAYTDLGGYYLIASPIGEVSPTNVTNMLENTYDLYCFDQSSDGSEWINYKGDNGNFNLVSGKGYLYANSQNDTLTFTGYPYNGNGQVTLSKTSGTHFEGWNLVGNPFAQTAYITKPFYTMNLEGSEVIASTSNSVRAMEGIFVVANEDGEIMTFSTEEPNRGAALVMNICQDRGSVIDRAILRFGDGNNLPKFMLDKNNTTLYIPQDNKDYAVVNANNVDEMPVNFKAAENGTYTLSFNMENVAFNYLHLIDTMTGADIDLLALRQAQGPASYTFEAKTTDQASRFRLVFSANETE